MNNFTKKIKNKKIVVSLLISYLLVLIVPYFVNRFNYVYIQNSLIQEISNYNAEHLNGRAKNVDATISNIVEMVNTIFFDKEFRDMSLLDGKLTKKERYHLSTDKSYIYEGLDFYVENVFVLYKNIDYYVGQDGAGNLKSLYRGHYNEKFASFDDWYNFMTERYYGELVVYPMPEKDGDGSVFYALSYMDEVNDKLLANILVEFKKSFLLSESNEKNTFCLVGDDNRVMVCDEGTDFVSSVNSAFKENPDKEIINIVHNGQKKVLISQKLTQSDWKYVSCISEDVFLKKVNDVRRSYIYSLLICVLIGGVIVFYGIKKHYTPIKKITKVLSQNFSYDYELDEYQYLVTVVSKIVSEYQNDSKYQKIEKRLAKNSFLMSVLKGEELLQPDIWQKLRYFNIDFSNNYFCVITVKIEDCSNLFFEEDKHDENIRLSKIIVENVTEDLIGTEYELAFCENDNEIILIVSLKRKEDIEGLNKQLLKVQSLVKTIFNVKISIAISNVYDDFRNISVCYRELSELVQLCRIRNNNFVKYSDLNDLALTEDEAYFYSAGIEQQLINHLMFGCYDDAFKLLKEILNNNIKNSRTTFLKTKCLFFDIVATVFKVIHENEYVAKELKLEKNDLLSSIDSYESIEEIEEELCNVFMRICNITKVNLAKNVERLSDEIMDFVQINYNDHNLNVAFIAGQFDLTANYVSSIFKKETGIALSEYINNVRIERAKNLLRTTNIKVGEISNRVGFLSFRTFSRIFSSTVGLSPGEFRKSSDS